MSKKKNFDNGSLSLIFSCAFDLARWSFLCQDVDNAAADSRGKSLVEFPL